MRRDNRRRENEGAKTLMYVAGSVVLLIIISVIIGIMVFGNKEDNVTESQFSTSKISDLVPNVISNQITEETSSEFGRTVNELENAIQNAVSTTSEEDNTTKNNTLTKNEASVGASIARPNEEVPDPEQLTDTGVEVVEQKETPVFAKPVEGEIIREFAKDKLVYSETLQEWITHNGIDIKADKTTIVKSAADGKISSIKNDPRYGLTVVIDHGNGFKTIYANLLTAEFITEGEAVTSGQTIGTVGNTATFEILDDAHLHFEIMQDGEYVDPSIYIK